MRRTVSGKVGSVPRYSQTLLWTSCQLPFGQKPPALAEALRLDFPGPAEEPSYNHWCTPQSSSSRSPPDSETTQKYGHQNTFDTSCASCACEPFKISRNADFHRKPQITETPSNLKNQDPSWSHNHNIPQYPTPPNRTVGIYELPPTPALGGTRPSHFGPVHPVRCDTQSWLLQTSVALDSRPPCLAHM